MNMELLKRKVGHNFPILTAWKMRRPKMVKKLNQRRELVNKVEQAAELMEDHQTRLLRAGVSPQQTQQIIKETWMMIPTEEMDPTWTLARLM